MAKRFEVTILGVNSAYPIHGRHPSCQIVNHDEKLFMIDCGEAAQIQVAKYNIKRGKINHIFISHLHGDHCYGLPGLLTSYALQGRQSELILHGPFGLKSFLDGVFESSGAVLPYSLIVKEYNTEISHSIEINPNLVVITFPMKHRIPTMGFRFNEINTTYNVKSSAIEKYAMSIEEIKAVKSGKSISRGGNDIALEDVTVPQPKERSYAYCSDTVYDKDLIGYVKECDLLYHETTYLDDLEALAQDRMHSTLGQAIEIAKSSNADRLITGHYSSRYKDVQIFYEEGIQHFDRLLLGEEGRVYEV